MSDSELTLDVEEAVTLQQETRSDPLQDHLSCLQAFDSARCKALMRVLTSIIWVAAPDGSFSSPQASWSAYTGQAWPQQQGFGWLNAVHPDDAATLRERFDSARQAREQFFAQGRVWHAASRQWRHCEARGVPILDGAGHVKEWVGTCKDVEDVHRAAEVMRENDRRKDEFIAVLAHELRNPLAPIRNAVHMLRLRGSDDMQLSWIRGIIERQVSHMAHLLDDLLDVSRIGQQKLELRRSRVTLDRILHAAIEVSRPQWEQHGQQFDLSVRAGPIYVNADQERMVQAFSNLLNNAAKYTDRGGRISLTVSEEAGQAVVSIRDTGIGISPEMLPRIFQLFSQDQPALERSKGGLGIGLSIVRTIVEMHGGTVEARSEGLGRGAEFVVRLPIEGRRAGNLVRTAPVPPQRRLRILVADDNHDTAESLAVLLEMMGHQVQVAYDGQEALQAAASLEPELALVDLGMPKLNGYQVAERLRTGSPRTVLVAVTGWGQPADVQRAQRAGFHHHLVKPVEPERLSSLLATVSSQSPPAGDAAGAAHG